MSTSKRISLEVGVNLVIAAPLQAYQLQLSQ
jgi:hypothetical protein